MRLGSLRVVFVILLVTVGPSWLMGCAAVAMRSAAESPSDMLAEDSAKSSAVTSLFPGDQLVLNDPQIEKIFSTKIGVPENAKLSVVRYGSWPIGFWSEEFARLDQQSMEAFLEKLRAVKRMRAVQVVPEMLLPRQMDIPHLREMAARVQAD